MQATNIKVRQSFSTRWSGQHQLTRKKRSGGLDPNFYAVCTPKGLWWRVASFRWGLAFCNTRALSMSLALSLNTRNFKVPSNRIVPHGSHQFMVDNKEITSWLRLAWTPKNLFEVQRAQSIILDFKSGFVTLTVLTWTICWFSLRNICYCFIHEKIKTNGQHFSGLLCWGKVKFIFIHRGGG